MIASAQMKEDLKKEIEKIIYYDTEILSKGIPAYSVGLIYSDSVFIYHFDDSKKNKEIDLTENSIFELGGLSKVFTASLIEILVSDSILDYQKPFNHYLEDALKNESLNDLTILDLITHHSNLPKLPYEFGAKEKEVNNPYAHYTKTDLLDFYKKYSPDTDKKKEYFYSNINFALLEIAIENSTGLPFDQVLQKKLLDPLNLQSTYVHNDPKNQKLPISGYSLSGNLVPPLKFQSFAGSEGLKSTMADLILFLQANMQRSNNDLSPFLIQTQQALAETTLNKYAKVAKGWHVFKPKKYHSAILHSGSTNGHRAYLAFVKETQTGVVVLSNSEHSQDGLGFLILRMLNHNWKKKKKKK